MLKKIIRKLIFGYKSSSDSYINHLRKKGCSIGEMVKIYSPNTTVIDETRPHLILIGSRVRITSGVVILAHDFSYCVCRSVYHDLINDHCKPTIIGNNVFLGMNSIVLPGVTIGDNCIVAAGAVVSHSIPPGSVAAGNPARVISSLDEFYHRRKQCSVSDAVELAKYWRRIKNGADPTIKEMSNFWWLFLPRDKNELLKNGINPSMSCDNTEDIVNDFLHSEPVFNSFEDFLNYSKQDIL